MKLCTTYHTQIATSLLAELQPMDGLMDDCIETIHQNTATLVEARNKRLLKNLATSKLLLERVNKDFKNVPMYHIVKNALEEQIEELSQYTTSME